MRLGRPEPQGVGGVNAIAQDRRVIGHAHHGFAADHHRIAPFRPDHFPGIAPGQPGVGALDLAFFADLLAEDAELVADAVADRRQLQAGQGFLEAGRQPPQATVAQARLRLFGNEVLQVEAQFTAGLLGGLAQAQVHQIVFQVGAKQVFSREIGGRAHVRLGVRVGRVHPVLQQPIAHRQGQGPVVVVAGGQAGGFGLAIEEVAPHRRGKGPSWIGRSGVFRHGAGWGWIL